MAASTGPSCSRGRWRLRSAEATVEAGDARPARRSKGRRTRSRAEVHDLLVWPLRELWAPQQRRRALISVAAGRRGRRRTGGRLGEALGLVSEAMPSTSTWSRRCSPSSRSAFFGPPADLFHQYGHGKAEHLAALAEASFLSLASVLIAGRALQRLLGSGHPNVHASGYVLATVIVVIAVDASRASISPFSAVAAVMVTGPVTARRPEGAPVWVSS